MLLTIIIFVLILSLLVMIHEAGHFFVAKKLGIKVEEFGFGLPPRAWGKKVGETIYSINWLPFGGFVKLYGEDEAGSGKIGSGADPTKVKEKKRAFFARPPRERAAVAIAGVVMNTLLAILIFYIFMFISGFKTDLALLGQHKFFLVDQKVKSEIIVGGTVKNSPAEKAALTVGSHILSINGKNVANIDQFTKEIKAYQGKEIILTWKDIKTGKMFTKKITPRLNPPKNEGALGVKFFSYDTVTLSYNTPMQKVFSGVIHPANLMAYNFDILGKLIGVSVKERTAKPLGEGVAGPVGIFSLVGTIVELPNIKERVLQLLNLTGILSLSLAFFNILPIPALDGGRLFFILIEGIFRKKVNQKFESVAHAVGMAVLLVLIIGITFKDILQFIVK